MATDRAQHLRRQALLVFTQQPEDAWQAANTVGDLGEQFSGGARTARVQMLDATLEAEPGKRIEVDHDGGLRRCRRRRKTCYTRIASRDVAARWRHPLGGGADGLFLCGGSGLGGGLAELGGRQRGCVGL